MELHPDATENFNKKADDLLLELCPLPQELLDPPKASFSPDVFTSYHLQSEDIIGEIGFSMRDWAGHEIAKYFPQNDKQIGIYGESYKKLELISEGMQKTLRGKVSFTLIIDLVFDWMREKYKNTTGLSMVEYVLGKCEPNIEELEIWIPIAMLYIQSEVLIGRIVLKPMTKDLFDYWRAEAEMAKPKAIGDTRKLFDREQKRLQGLAAATIKVHAEPQRAFEIALEETERSIGALRFFSPSNFHPEVISYCAILGKENLESAHYWTIQDGKLVYISSITIDKSVRRWVIDDETLSMFMNDGLKMLSDLLSRESRTEFQERLLDSLLLYTRSSLTKNLTDRLIYILVALESILLKDERENIQQNVGERMAFFIGRNKGRRRLIISNLKKAYELRSSFIHHGRSVRDVEILREFMLNAWDFFSQLIQNANHFRTKKDLIDAIEERKLQ